MAARVIEAIKALPGQASTGAIATKLSCSVWSVRQAAEQLQAAGQIHRTGTGAQNFRWVLGGQSAAPAKEVP